MTDEPDVPPETTCCSDRPGCCGDRAACCTALPGSGGAVKADTPSSACACSLRPERRGPYDAESAVH